MSVYLLCSKGWARGLAGLFSLNYDLEVGEQRLKEQTA